MDALDAQRQELTRKLDNIQFEASDLGGKIWDLEVLLKGLNERYTSCAKNYRLLLKNYRVLKEEAPVVSLASYKQTKESIGNAEFSLDSIGKNLEDGNARLRRMRDRMERLQRDEKTVQMEIAILPTPLAHLEAKVIPFRRP